MSNKHDMDDFKRIVAGNKIIRLWRLCITPVWYYLLNYKSISILVTVMFSNSSQNAWKFCDQTVLTVWDMNRSLHMYWKLEPQTDWTNSVGERTLVSLQGTYKDLTQSGLKTTVQKPSDKAGVQGFRDVEERWIHWK